MPQETLNSLDDLAAFAKRFLARFPQGAVVGLSGELGAGKTAFVKKIAEQIDSAAQITSPSFVIHVSYAQLSTPIEHFDFYRLDTLDEKSLSEIGYFDALVSAKDGKGFVFVEWPERAKTRGILDLDVMVVFTLNADGSRAVGVETLG